MLFTNSFLIELQAYDLYMKKLPHYRQRVFLRCLANSCRFDNMFPNDMEEHDKLFEPRNRYEQRLWERCRAINKKATKGLLIRVEAGSARLEKINNKAGNNKTSA